MGLLITPEERVRPTIGRLTSTRRPLHRATISSLPDLKCIVAEDWRRRVHLALVDSAEEEASGDVDPGRSCRRSQDQPRPQPRRGAEAPPPR